MRFILFSISVLTLLAACKSNTTAERRDENMNISFDESSLVVENDTSDTEEEEPIDAYYQKEYFDIYSYSVDEETAAGIPSDSIGYIGETYYVEVFRPEIRTFEDEESEEAETYFTSMGDLGYYMYTARERMESLGIENFVSNERFLMFDVGDCDPIFIDIEKHGAKALFLLYKKGKVPLIIDIVSSYDDDRIVPYLEL